MYQDLISIIREIIAQVVTYIKGDKSDNNFFMWPFTCLFVNLLNYLVKFQIIDKLDSILNVIIDKYTY
jgi:hypothetical protein